MMGFYVTGELFGILKVLMKLRGSSRMANGVSRGMNAAILDRRAVRESVLGMTSGHLPQRWQTLLHCAEKRKLFGNSLSRLLISLVDAGVAK